MECLKRAGLLLVASVVAATPVGASESSILQGAVVSDAAPLVRASVWAYQIATSTYERQQTGADGRFEFAELPQGLYKVIAAKRGFAAQVVKVSLENRLQTVNVQLLPDPIGDPRAAEVTDPFFAARGEIPPDVLREIYSVTLQEGLSERLADFQEIRMPKSSLSGEVQASFGVDALTSAGEGEVAEGLVGLEGQLGQLELALAGRVWNLNSQALGQSAAQTSSVSVQLRAPDRTSLAVSSVNNHFSPVVGGGDPVEFENYRIEWQQRLGERSQSAVSAQYTSESNFYRQGWVQPVDVPDASETWRVEGTYRTTLTERSSLEAGVRVRTQEWAYDGSGLESEVSPAESLELFGRGGFRARPTVLVEYGLATRMRDGSFALRPHGELVVQLGSAWQAAASATQSIRQESEDMRGDFVPLTFELDGNCGSTEESCYQVVFTRARGDDERLAVAAVHRRIGETLRLYFRDDLVHHLESLYVVRGDEIPQIKFALTRRLNPHVLARLESTAGMGGGGILYATDTESPYENRVRYLVTSVNAQIQPTATGIFLAFHHLEQDLEPTLSRTDQAPRGREIERLQLMLTQDLDVLVDLAADWAVQLNLELSRTQRPLESNFLQEGEEEFRRRITGGLSIRF